jgi:hypothetical protein
MPSQCSGLFAELFDPGQSCLSRCGYLVFDRPDSQARIEVTAVEREGSNMVLREEGSELGVAPTVDLRDIVPHSEVAIDTSSEPTLNQVLYHIELRPFDVHPQEADGRA